MLSDFCFNHIAFIPEIFILFVALKILMLGVFFPKRSTLLYYLSQIALLMVAGLTWAVFYYLNFSKTVIFHGSFMMDALSVYLKLFIYLSVFCTFIYAKEYNKQREIPATEFYALGLLSLLGMMILISSANLLTLFLGMELFSLPTYAMVAMYRQKTVCVEAGMKYFIIGAIASGMLLYGISMVFGATKSLNLLEIAQTVTEISLDQNLILMVGLAFIAAGIAFKLGAAPFHMWVPDVYQGAPSSITLFISTAPKIAAYAMLMRLFVDGLPGLQMQWHGILILIAILSMAIGNIAAIVQTNIKRMLAYSSIAHMGYMLLGVLCGTSEGYAAAMFYIITYSLMTITSFGVVILMSQRGFEAENIEDFAGLSSRNPWLAFIMMLTLFSLSGIPPLVGFIAKVSILDALIKVDLLWLAILAVLFAIVGAYYYIRVVKVIYFESSPTQLTSVEYSWGMKIAISLNAFATIAIGIFPGWLYTLVHLPFNN